MELTGQAENSKQVQSNNFPSEELLFCELVDHPHQRAQVAEMRERLALEPDPHKRDEIVWRMWRFLREIRGLERGFGHWRPVLTALAVCSFFIWLGHYLIVRGFEQYGIKGCSSYDTAPECHQDIVHILRRYGPATEDGTAQDFDFLHVHYALKGREEYREFFHKHFRNGVDASAGQTLIWLALQEHRDGAELIGIHWQRDNHGQATLAKNCFLNRFNHPQCFPNFAEANFD